MNKSLVVSEVQIREFFATINRRSDRIMQWAIVLYFLNGLFLAFFYDTWLVAFGVGGLCLLAFFSVKNLLPNYSLYQYVGSAVSAIFMAQFIYQMHGMFEMHFWAYVAATLLISYQNWKLYIPLALIIVVHHAGFAYLQFAGIKDIYFTQMEYMDLKTFAFHSGLAVLIVLICAYWAYDLSLKTVEDGFRRLSLEKQLRNVDKNIHFAEEISKGNLKIIYEQDNEDDYLGKALTDMQQNLLKAHQREQQERFITEGLAKINEILRKTNDLKELGDAVLFQLISYMKLNQGGLFLKEEVEGRNKLVLCSCYAYNRKKYQQKEVEIGEGLVGQAYLEKDYLYLTDVPEGYTHITSGLGDATPSCILIVPLLHNDEVVGVLEVASLRLIPESYIEFLQKVTESMASTILSARTNQQTKILLEQAQSQTEILRSQEEEVKQNMEELVATQEELTRRSKEYEELLEEKENEIQKLKAQLTAAYSV